MNSKGTKNIILESTESAIVFQRRRHKTVDRRHGDAINKALKSDKIYFLFNLKHVSQDVQATDEDGI